MISAGHAVQALFLEDSVIRGERMPEQHAEINNGLDETGPSRYDYLRGSKSPSLTAILLQTMRLILVKASVGGLPATVTLSLHRYATTHLWMIPRQEIKTVPGKPHQIQQSHSRKIRLHQAGTPYGAHSTDLGSETQHPVPPNRPPQKLLGRG